MFNKEGNKKWQRNIKINAQHAVLKIYAGILFILIMELVGTKNATCMLKAEI